MKFVPANAQHIGKREQQQDAFAFSSLSDADFTSHAGFLVVVADGMGGLANGALASGTAVKSFLVAYQQKLPSESIQQAMDRAFQTAHRDVGQLNISAGIDAGSTLAAAVAHLNNLYWVATGDSRIYLLRGRTLTQVNRDHTYGERLLDEAASGCSTRADALSHPERGHLTAYLGVEGIPEADRSVRPFRLEPGDRVLVCTDGVYRSIDEKDMAVAFEGDLRKGCEAIQRIVLERDLQGQDNLTIAALLCEDSAVVANLRHRHPVWLVVLVSLLLADIVSGVAAVRALVQARAHATPIPKFASPKPKIAVKPTMPSRVEKPSAPPPGSSARQVQAEPAPGQPVQVLPEKGRSDGTLTPATGKGRQPENK